MTNKKPTKTLAKASKQLDGPSLMQQVFTSKDIKLPKPKAQPKKK